MSRTILPFAVGDEPVLVSHVLCPYVQRALIVLAEKGVAHRRIDVDLADKPTWFSALSPLGKTPMLLQRDGAAIVPLFESAVICDYLDETHAPALHPAAPLARARHRAWVEFGSAVLQQIGQLYGARDRAGFDAACQGLRQRCETLERELAAHGGSAPWFGGAAFSIVDAAFAPAWRYFEVIEPAAATGIFDGLPRLAAWRAALAARASVRAAVAPDYAERLREFIVQRDSWLGRRLVETTLSAAPSP
ncbi:glutathione S-transferase family protein [Aquincola sp. S2]|uniref:Glutathione S-transferase family protein n=1 Tax=Pseudaquabacterium terrae TaxID=2732868 RepID=A0ABX2EKX0_9BURK|nr:glutathione S-transferase family protein [Aquabacterium terrae]NRF69220.1 glutathione S-transferase family protein [Aquabacterium terrae]